MADFTMMAQAVLSFVLSQTRDDGDESTNTNKRAKHIGKDSRVSDGTTWAPNAGLLPELLNPLGKLCNSLLDAALISQKDDRRCPEISNQNTSSVQKSSDGNRCVDLAAGDNVDPAPWNKPHQPTWRIASAAVNHMTGNPDVLTTYTPMNGDLNVHVANMGLMQVCGIGSVNTPNVVLQNVWYVPGLELNLVSAGQLTKLGHKVSFGSYGCRISKGTDNNVVGKAHFTDDFQFAVEFVKVPSTN